MSKWAVCSEIFVNRKKVDLDQLLSHYSIEEIKQGIQLFLETQEEIEGHINDVLQEVYR